MSAILVIHKGRTNIVAANVGMNVSADTITSQIRTEPDQDSALIATWTVTKPNGGADGELLLKLTAAQTSNIEERRGYMDIKRISGSDVYPVFSQPLRVDILGTVTV